MHELILKINLLDGLSKQKVIAYVDELLGKQQANEPAFDVEAYKQKLLTLSVWGEEEIHQIEEASKQINWELEKW
ncbi:MAG: hypothetical protein AAF694_12295 [Bacteroidota bacterium]